MIDVILTALLFVSIGMLVYANIRRMTLTLHLLNTSQPGYWRWVKEMKAGNAKDPFEMNLYQDYRRWMVRGYGMAALVVMASFILAWVHPLVGR